MPQNLDRELLYLLHDVARLIRVKADQRARTRGMTRAQWVILSRLERQPGLSQNEMVIGPMLRVVMEHRARRPGRRTCCCR